MEALRRETRLALQAIVWQEAEEVAARRRTPSINCRAEELRVFAEAVGLSPSQLPPGWEALCLPAKR